MGSGGAKGANRGRLPIKKTIKLDDVRNEINVTPLVDVCLVLLIIFMVVTPLMARGKEVPLPATEHHRTEKDKSQPVVAIDGKGKLYFDTEVVPDLDELQRRVQEHWKLEQLTERKVYVKADSSLPYKKVYPLIMAMHDLGIEGVDLGTVEARGKEQ